MVVGIPVIRFNGYIFVLIRVEIENRGGPGESKVTAWGRGCQGVHRGHFQVPIEMAVMGGKRQSICHPALHMSQRSILCSSNGL